jgi:predicted secreted protein
MEMSGSTEVYRTTSSIIDNNAYRNAQSNTYVAAMFEQNKAFCVRIINFTRNKFQDEFFKVDYSVRGFKTPLSNQINGQCQ